MHIPSSLIYIALYLSFAAAAAIPDVGDVTTGDNAVGEGPIGNAPVTVVGHSLGAAISLLDGVYLPLHLPAGSTVDGQL
ncbi:hypothetical protein OG21DRAFT_1486081 [Imleria badia]|nr:hypothetical protein OG21DRAFT_1486081 [Imleria badia]